MTAPEAALRRAARRWPDAPALVVAGHPGPDEILSFAALDRRVDAVAMALPRGRALGAAGVGAVDLALLALAAPRAGMAFSPANTHLTDEQRGLQFAQAGIDVDIRAMPAAGACPLTPLPPDAVHLIVATSGSTGTPKGAMLTGANLAAAVAASNEVVPLAPGDVWLGCLPLSAIGGLSVLFRCLEAGAAMRLHRRFDATVVGHALASGAATHVSLVPAMLAQLLDAAWPPSPRLACVLVGGAALPQALAERAAAAGWPVRPTYGMSETGSQIATCADLLGWTPGLAGLPLPGLAVDVTASGRLRVRGAAVMAGYANPQLRPGDGLAPDGAFVTGDLGRIDEHGRVVVLGRADDVIVSGGVNVQPTEVEALAARCPGVRAVAVAGQPDPRWGERLLALVVGDLTEDAFLDWCRHHVPSPMRPRAAVTVEALPLLASGKLDRLRMRQMAAAMNEDAGLRPAPPYPIK